MFFFFKQKTADEMRISDWSSDVCSSDLLVSVEAYPQLKSNENFLTLQSQLEGTENRIAVARRDYNEAVRDYNTRIRTLQEMVGAKMVHGAQPITPFEGTTPGPQEAPKIAFAGCTATDHTALFPNVR